MNSRMLRTKIRIPQPYNEREVVALQSALFNMGFEWTTFPKDYRKEPDMVGIFIGADGKMCWTRIRNDFVSHPYYEVSIQIYTDVQLVEPVRQSIEVLGQKYDIEDIRKAVSKLEPVLY